MSLPDLKRVNNRGPYKEGPWDDILDWLTFATMVVFCIVFLLF